MTSQRSLVLEVLEASDEHLDADYEFLFESPQQRRRVVRHIVQRVPIVTDKRPLALLHGKRGLALLRQLVDAIDRLRWLLLGKLGSHSDKLTEIYGEEDWTAMRRQADEDGPL